MVHEENDKRLADNLNMIGGIAFPGFWPNDRHDNSLDLKRFQILPYFCE